MKRATILATAISLFGSLGVHAEPLRTMAAPGGAIPAFEAVTITRSMGLDPLGGPVWRNGRYVLLATDDDGREMRVVLDAYDGSVLAVRPLARGYFEPGGRDYGPRDYVVREEYDTVAPVVPPLPRGTHAVPPQRRVALTPPASDPHKPVQKKPAGGEARHDDEVRSGKTASGQEREIVRDPAGADDRQRVRRAQGDPQDRTLQDA